jgi:5'-deoxynucleotidase YfbR-like HD superfamily hydrolase
MTNDRTLADALRNANRLRGELPLLIQPSASDYDIVTLADEIESLRSRLADAEREARVLVVAMADQFGAPDNWKPLPDAAGMITQISNMVAGLRDERALIVARAENAEAALEHVTELYTQACEQRDDADALLREIYSYAEDQGMETLMDMIDAPLAREEKP